MTEQQNNFPFLRQLVFMFVFIMAAGLLVGASRLGDSLLSRQQTREQNRKEWYNTATAMVSSDQDRTPEQKQFRQFAAESPELFINLACGRLEVRKQ